MLTSRNSIATCIASLAAFAFSPNLASEAFGQIETPATRPASPVLNAHQRSADDAVKEIYATLEAAGYVTGPGSISRDPLLINGKPAIVIFIGQQHTADGVKWTDVLLRELKGRYKVDVRLEEGVSYSPETERKLKELVEPWAHKIKAITLTEAEKKDLEVIETDRAYAPSWSKVKYGRVLGWESEDLQEYLDHFQILYHHLGIELVQDGVERDGRYIILIGGKFVNEVVARMANVEEALTKRFGAEFPVFDVPMAQGVLTDKSGKEHAAFFFTKEHLKAIQEHRKRADDFFLRHERTKRNETLAKQVKKFFGNEREEAIAAVIVGENHILELDHDGKTALTRLENSGISCVTVLAREPRKNDP